MVTPKVSRPEALISLLQLVPHFSPDQEALVERAYHYAKAAHKGQKRKSGEPYFTHCVAVATILAELNLDAETIAAGLLHDVIEDNKTITLTTLEENFGREVIMMVDGVTKLDALPKSAENSTFGGKKAGNKNMEYFRKMMMTLNDDVRVVMVKLADRLHNMRTLGYMPRKNQLRTAQETLDIFAPLANRLGIWQIKWELEDLSFRYLEPEHYRAIASSLDERRQDRESYVHRVKGALLAKLNEQGIKEATITARPKHIYSIYSKMQRKNLPLEQIYDVRAVRVIVNETHECYTALGTVHGLWRPIAGEFDDYIAQPKENFYQSLHTAVIDNEGKTLEVQIRTREMHQHAEYGVAAHWRYKEGGAKHDEAFEKRIAYLRKLMSFDATETTEDAEVFMDNMRSEVFENRVYVYTPSGDLIDLPKGATPIDFAYHIHTDVGHRCRSAKVHGEIKPLNYQLKTSDQVEIMTAKRGGPSLDWLNQDLGYVKTSRARAKIRHWFKQHNREYHITSGREVVERTMKRLGVLDRMSFEQVAKLCDFDKIDDFFAAIGEGRLTSSSISNKILEDERRREEEARSELEQLQRKVRPSFSVDASSGVTILGVGGQGMLVNIARCCNPVPGDGIIGYVTRGRGISVHRVDCKNLGSLNDANRLIDVSWGKMQAESKYQVPIKIIAHDRHGLIRDISTIISDENINMSDVSVDIRQHIAIIHIIIEISDNLQLTRLLPKIESVDNVVEANRKQS